MPESSFWQRRAAVPVPSGRGFRALPPTLRLRLLPLLPVLRVGAVAFLAVAIARPRIGEVNAVVPARGIDIALSFDISSSMTAAELAPGKDRLQATKEVIREFIANRENDRIGLVVFQRDALALSPPTQDYAALDRMVADIESGLLADGTGIGVGLSSALNMLRDSSAASRVVILLTDGEHNATSITPEAAAQLAAALQVKVYTIGVISPGRADGIDEERLRGIADLTGGGAVRMRSASAAESRARSVSGISSGSWSISRPGRLESTAMPSSWIWPEMTTRGMGGRPKRAFEGRRKLERPFRGVKAAADQPATRFRQRRSATTAHTASTIPNGHAP